MLQRLRKSKSLRLLSLTLVVSLILEIVFPVTAYALTAGPSSPEFSSFEPIGTTDMVNDFTGEFTYSVPVLNIPGSDGGGYALSLSYHSGVSSEQEASWVGFGWTLNPGAINVQTRGNPDGFKGVKVEKYNKARPNWTQSAGFDFNMELNSQDKEKKDKGEGQGKSLKMFKGKFNMQLGSPSLGYINQDDDDKNYENLFSLSLSKTIRQNNYTGISISNSIGAGFKGMANLNLTRAGGQTTLGFSINPINIFQEYYKKKTKKLIEKANNKFFEEDSKIEDGFKIIDKVKRRRNVSYGLGLLSSSYQFQSYNAPALPYSINYNVGRSFNISGSIQVNPVGTLGFQVGLRGNLNTQIPIPKTDVYAYGYMYHPNYNTYGNIGDKKFYDLSAADKIIEGDYQLEKATTFNKHDKNLGIPFGNPDIYVATGNDVLGGFRFHHNKIGHFYPNFLTNKQKIRQLGVEFGIGQAIQIGFDLGIGNQKTKVKQWKETNIEGLEFDTPGATLPFFQFSNDPGGELRYSDDDVLQFASIKSNKELNFSDFTNDNELKNDFPGQSSFIEYSYFDATGNIVSSVDNDYNTLNGPSDQVAQIKVTNKDGGKSVYGLPVFTKEQKDLIVELGASNFKDGSYLSHGQQLFYDDPMQNQTAIGKYIQESYPTNYLLTHNTTFDYVDIGNDGPDTKDFGGWTKFVYRKAHGDNDWYRFRAPYTGLIYNRGNIFDGRDQTGSVSSGYKEVYYTDYIESKTHIAIFVTNKTLGSDYNSVIQNASPSISSSLLNDVTNSLNGSQDGRLDGLDAAAISGGMDIAANDPNAKGSNELEKLERIVLYAKSDFSKPITSTFFDYDYSLCKGLPNSSAQTFNDSGKLTLRRVWTESGGVFSSSVSPYQFHYNYRNTYPTEVLGKYPELLDSKDIAGYYANLSSAAQNPNYKRELLDMWGFNQENGKTRYEKMQPWVSQKPPIDPAQFDPAAWQLKRIVFPSGGEINVQYEQKNYAYVQDQKAMAMVSLEDNYNNGFKSDDNKYFINYSDLGLSSDQLIDYLNTLQEYFINKENKLYFKILYGYIGAPGNILNPNNVSSLEKTDYITGYTEVNEVGLSGNDIYFVLGALKNNGNGKKDKTMPRWVCFEKLLTNAGHVLHDNPNDWIDRDNDILDLAYDYNEGAPGVMDLMEYTDEGDSNHPLKKIRKSKAISGTFKLFGDWVKGDLRNVKKKKACEELNYNLSYFKLPVHKEKKGGGIRVSKILSYDPGIETGAAMVYGTEYIYELEDGSTSGVATNEPSEGHEENALVGFLERKKQDGIKGGIDKLLNGRNSKTFEGPLGQSLLPSAQVSHQRVVIRNIHDGITSTGFQVNKYFTVKDYPSVKVEFSDISKKNDTYKKFNLSLPLGLFNYRQQKYWVTQGYLFKTNDMQGKPKSQLSYAGNYNQVIFNPDTYISGTIYNYTEPGEKIKALTYDAQTFSFTEEILSPGLEEDLNMYSSCVEDVTNDFSMEIDLSFLSWASITLGFGFSYNFEDLLLCQHVTSKVLSQKSYLKSTTTFIDGIAQTTRNIAFDRYTGDPVLTSTYDSYENPVSGEIFTALTAVNGEHSGKYFNLNIPASWVYDEMGPIDRDNLTLFRSNQLTASTGNVTTYGTDPLNGLSGNAFTDVVAASATVYKNDYWFTSSNENIDLLNTEFLTGVPATKINELNQNYYPLQTYVYRDAVSSANNAAQIYNGGLMSNVPFFDWNSTSPFTTNQGNWFSASEVISYSPHGYPIEEKDALGIRNTAKFGYDKTLPILVAQNTDYNSVHFIDFEYDLAGINNNMKSEKAHTGHSSYNLSQDPMVKLLDNATLSDNLFNKGGSIKLWLKSSLSDNPLDLNYGLKNSSPELKANINGNLYDFDAVAQTGEWTLYEVFIQDWNGLVPGDIFDLSFSYNFQTNEEVLIDDFRIQPIDAVMNCTVYYPDFKVAAQFDDQHFSVIYEYNSKGELVRKSIETEKGRKILQEQQYNVPKILR